MKRNPLESRFPHRALAPFGLAIFLAACGGGGGGLGNPGGPSQTNADRFVLVFDSTMTSKTRITSNFSVTTTSEVHGQVALAAGSQPGQYGMSSGDLSYVTFAYNVSNKGGCTFTTSTTNASLTVVEASVSPGNPDAIRVVLSPSSALREEIVQNCPPSPKITIPGIYWFGAWQTLHRAEGSAASKGWIITGWSAGSGDVVGVKSYSHAPGAAQVGSAVYGETTTIQLQRR